MTPSDVAKATRVAIAQIQEKLAPLGMVEGAYEAFRAGHMPEKGAYWYSATVFNGLSEAELDKLEDRLPYPVPEQSKAVLPPTLRQFLSVTNGMHCHNLSIYGDQGRMDHGVGMPIDLGTPQLVRPPNISKLWFCFGSMNGPSTSQGKLYLTEDEEVFLAHRDTGDIGARWSGMVEFLTSEVPRLLAAHDARGDILPGMSELPGNTENWEATAERAKYGLFLWRKPFRRFSIWIAGLRRH